MGKHQKLLNGRPAWPDLSGEESVGSSVEACLQAVRQISEQIFAVIWLRHHKDLCGGGLGDFKIGLFERTSVF